MIKFTLVVLSLFCSFLAYSTELFMGPYLESQTEDSMSVKWETKERKEMVLKWGDGNLDLVAKPDIRKSPIGTFVYMAVMKKLASNKIYQYAIYENEQAVTDTVSFRARVSFKDKDVFRFLAISDTQEHPEVHKRLIEEGVIPHLEENFVGAFYENLDFAIVAGDLVNNGKDYHQFKEVYFDPAKKLQASIPYFPAAGNHDRDYKNFLFYFDLPDNGFGKERKHWYTYKYLNARFLSINTDKGFLKIGQLAWVDRVMRLACREKDVDFVFAYYHHPWHSEMWLDGNTPYTKLVMNKMQRHLRKCGKAGAAFNGHTHAYSRGQNADQPIYYVNIASAGGNLDYWGEDEQKDYADFQKSYDEYGYSIIEVRTGPNPSFKIQRFSMGDDYVQKTNELQDEFYYRKYNIAPNKPIINLVKDEKSCYLDSGEFIDLDGDKYQSVQWQISTFDYPIVASGGVLFSQPSSTFFETLFNHENIYNGDTSRPGWSVHEDRDTMAGKIYNRLTWPKWLAADEYTVRARYRDRGLVWSEWAEQNVSKKQLKACL
ncbi:MAG: metallophosphoesterase [Bacteriovoracaceae bacterium]|nr:metallophosphoesterase [Bacteriovoracaceae bacterium]